MTDFTTYRNTSFGQNAKIVTALVNKTAIFGFSTCFYITIHFKKLYYQNISGSEWSLRSAKIHCAAFRPHKIIDPPYSSVKLYST